MGFTSLTRHKIESIILDGLMFDKIAAWQTVADVLLFDEVRLWDAWSYSRRIPPIPRPLTAKERTHLIDCMVRSKASDGSAK